LDALSKKQEYSIKVQAKVTEENWLKQLAVSVPD
jgi:hypothetical protein